VAIGHEGDTERHRLAGRANQKNLSRKQAYDPKTGPLRLVLPGGILPGTRWCRHVPSSDGMQRATAMPCTPQPTCVAAHAGEPAVYGEIVVCHTLD